jgi:hypothetical protein
MQPRTTLPVSKKDSRSNRNHGTRRKRVIFRCNKAACEISRSRAKRSDDVV